MVYTLHSMLYGAFLTCALATITGKFRKFFVCLGSNALRFYIRPVYCWKILIRDPRYRVAAGIANITFALVRRSEFSADVCYIALASP